jgi:hypothetical protein
MFHMVRTSLVFVNAQAVNEFLGMHQFFGGKASAALVENFSPHAADAVVIAGDREPSLMTEIVVCQTCFNQPIDLPLLGERVHERRRRANEALDPPPPSDQGDGHGGIP